jgi:hypothetical protein
VHAGHEALAPRVSLGKMKLVGDVDKDGGAAWRDAAAGDEHQQPGQKELHLEGGDQLRGVAKKFNAEIFGVIVGVLAGEIGSCAQGEVTEAEPELQIRARKAASLAIGEAMVAAGRFAIHFDSRRRKGRTFRDGAHSSSMGGYPPHENA